MTTRSKNKIEQAMKTRPTWTGHRKLVVADSKYLKSLERINNYLLSEGGLSSCKACGVAILPSMSTSNGLHMYCRSDKQAVTARVNSRLDKEMN